jgi:hypothetical protein
MPSLRSEAKPVDMENIPPDRWEGTEHAAFGQLVLPRGHSRDSCRNFGLILTATCNMLFVAVL